MTNTLSATRTRYESAALGVAEAMDEVVVDHADGLHEGVADRRADEFEAALFEVLAHGVRFGARGGDVFERFPVVADRRSINKLPEIGIERSEFLLDFKHGAGVGHGGLNFEPVADDAGILEQRVDFTFVVTGDFSRIEVVERLAIILPFVQDRLPAQARLGDVEHQKFEQLTIVVHGRTPFGVVVLDHQLVVTRPIAAFFHRLFSGQSSSA